MEPERHMEVGDKSSCAAKIKTQIRRATKAKEGEVERGQVASRIAGKVLGRWFEFDVR